MPIASAIVEKKPFDMRNIVVGAKLRCKKNTLFSTYQQEFGGMRDRMHYIMKDDVVIVDHVEGVLVWAPGDEYQYMLDTYVLWHVKSRVKVHTQLVGPYFDAMNPVYPRPKSW